MKIFIKTPTGRTITLTLDAVLTIHDIKQKIQDYEGIHPDQQRLNFAGSQLQDTQTLIDCNVREESTLQLALQMGNFIDLSVQTDVGDNIVVRVDPEYLVRYIKIRIHETKGIPIEQQIIIFAGTMLEEGRRIKEYNLDPQSAIWLVKMDDPFKCPVCKENFQGQGDRAPHGLHCGHSFCHQDIRQLIEGKDSICCPVCNRETHLTDFAGGCPAKNVALLESLTRSQDTFGLGGRASVVMCDNCDASNQQQATVACEKCEVEFCDECDAQVHAPKSLRSHVRVPVTKKPSAPMKCKVSSHGEPLNRFCADCQALVCAICVEVDGPHHGHNYRLVAVIAAEKKKKLSDQTAHCFENLCDLQGLTKDLRDVERSLEANKDACLAAFNADTEIIRAAVNARCDAIAQRISDVVQSRQQEARGHGEAATGGLWRVDACVREGLAAMASPDSKFLAGMGPVSRRLEECNAAMDELLARAEVPSAAVDYATGADGRGKHVAALLQAIAQFDCELAPFDPRPVRNASNAANAALFGTCELGDLVVEGAVTVPSGQVLQYRNVTVRSGGTLSVAGWDGTSGGDLRVYVRGRLEVEAGGRIDLSGLGYRGGASCYTSNDGQSYQGESSLGPGGASAAANGAGGAGGMSVVGCGWVGGGGGGHGTAGSNSPPNTWSGGIRATPGGGECGSEVFADDAMLVRGSGGGGGSGYNNAPGGAGGAGGGLLLIRARQFCNRGEIRCNGLAGANGSGQHTSGGGGGSGGSIKAVSGCFEHVAIVSAEGGAAGQPGNISSYPASCTTGGSGGVGRIRLEVIGAGTSGGIIPATATSAVGATARSGTAAPLDVSQVTPKPSVVQ